MKTLALVNYKSVIRVFDKMKSKVNEVVTVKVRQHRLFIECVMFMNAFF